MKDERKVVEYDPAMMTRAKALYPYASNKAIVRVALADFVATQERRHAAIDALVKAEVEGTNLPPAPPVKAGEGWQPSDHNRARESERVRIIHEFGR